MRNPTCCPARRDGFRTLALSLTTLLLLPLVSYAEPMSISGYTEPTHDSKLGLAVTGRVATVNVREGQAVKQGQALLELDQRLEKLEAQRRELLWRNRAEVDAAKRQLETLTRQLNDTQSLYKSTGSVAREELEKQELELDLASIDLKRLENAEEREELEYNIAREDLRKRTLLAPFAGKVVALLVKEGENCEPDTPLVHLVATSPVNFVANVELGLSQKLKPGQAVDLHFQVGGEAVKRGGEIIFISPVIDPASGLRTIKARFDNPNGKVIPGITGELRFNAE